MKKQNLYKEHVYKELVLSIPDTIAFWKNVKKLTKKNIQKPNISNDMWVNHFQNLLNQNVNIEQDFATFIQEYINTHDINCDNCQNAVEGECSELNCEISETEISNCIKSFKNGKSPGIDGVEV